MKHICVHCGEQTKRNTRLSLPLCSRECGQEYLRAILGTPRHADFVPVRLEDYRAIPRSTDFYALEKTYHGD